MGTLPNKREILESIIDEQDDFWIIMKPSRNNPTDPDYLCVLQNPAEYKEARVEIPTAWFLVYGRAIRQNPKRRSGCN